MDVALVAKSEVLVALPAWLVGECQVVGMLVNQASFATTTMCAGTCEEQEPAIVACV